MTQGGIIRRFSRLFQSGLIGLRILSPSAFIAFLALADGGETRWESLLTFHGLFAITAILALGLSRIAFVCYSKSGEPSMRYISWGLLCAGLGAIEKVFLPFDLINAQGPNIFISAMMLVALNVWKAPLHTESKRKNTALALTIVIGAQILMIGASQWPANHMVSFATIVIAITSLPVILRLRPINHPLYLIFGVLWLNAQTAFALLLGDTWSPTWWFGKILCPVLVLILGQAVTRAYLIRQPLRTAQTELQIIALMHQAEEAAQSANRAIAAKTQFMAAASHDLRQPLVPIKLFAELLEVETQSTKLHPMVRKMQSAVQSLDDLLNKMLEFSRLESGVVRPQIERIRVGELLERFHQEFGPVAVEQGLELRWVNSKIMVSTDRILLEQILRNLVQNAIRYTKAGKILIGCRRQGNLVRLCVIDTGIGIALDQQRNIFTEFYQGADSTKGFGLGLATVERLSKLLNAPIELKSRPHKGSCFAVTLPSCSERRTILRPPAIVKPVNPGNLRILVLDDEAAVRDSLISTLVRWDWEPLVATTIAEAEEILVSEDAPDALLTDLRLGSNECGLDAITALRHLAEDDLPCVIMTGDASHPRLAEALASPWPVLVKPFSMDELYSRLANAVLAARASSNDDKI